MSSSELEGSSDEEIQSDEVEVMKGDSNSNGESEAGESESDNSDEDGSTVEAPAIDASSTESDEDDNDEEVDDDKDVPKPAKIDISAQRMEKINNFIQEKYVKRQGRQLYIRFPEKLPTDAEEFETKVKALSSLIVTAHKPRQKHARFCLVDFASTEDRDETMKQMKKTISETKIVVSIPRTESSDFIKTLAEKKLKQIEKKREKRLLKKQNRKATLQKEFTSTIVVLNIPKSASTGQVKELFPDAVDIQMKPAANKLDGISIATITLPSTADARKNVRRDLSLGGTKLMIRFNNSNKKVKVQKKNPDKKKLQKKKQQKKKAETEPSNGELKATIVGNASKQKKKNATNGAKAEQPIPTKKAKLPLLKKRGNDDEGESEVPQKKAKVPVGVTAPQKKAKVPVGVTAPQKKAKVPGDVTAPQKKPPNAGDSKPLKTGKPFVNAKGNKNFAQKKGNAVQNKKGGGKKPNQPNNQKKQPQKKGKLAAK